MWVCKNVEGASTSARPVYWDRVPEGGLYPHPDKGVSLYLRLGENGKPNWVLERTIQRYRQIADAAKRKELEKEKVQGLKR